MVRFKGSKSNYRAHKRKIISIPVWCDLKQPLIYLQNHCKYFNSSMVRFKANGIDLTNENIPYFNSSMVRFKDFELSQILHIHSRISIPVWCDLKKVVNELPTILSHFNSSMVRFKAPDTTKRKRYMTLISIPVWCDLKFKGGIWGSYKSSFQFQYGAI